jgi:hypothetical protein
MKRFATAAMLVTGCATVKVGTQISPQQVGTKYARLTGYMATRGAAPGGRHTESTPRAIRHDALLDEATLQSLSPVQTCIAVVVRTSIANDEPLDQYKTTFQFNGVTSRALIENERVTVVDYTYEGVRNVVSAEGVAANEYLGLTISAPAEKVFRVIERQGQLCAGVGGAVSSVYLELEHPSWDVAGYHYHLGYDWQVR